MRTGTGIALVSVLLLLSAMLIMALTMQLLALLGALATRNQLSYAAADAEVNSRLHHSILLLEQQSAGGELPITPELPGWSEYSLRSETVAHLVVHSGQPPHLALEALIRLDGARIEVMRVN